MLILASKSPRRRQLLSELGFPIRIVDVDVDESLPNVTNAREIPERLAILKSEAFKEPMEDDDILVTADTIVVFDGKVLGKPKDSQEASEMLHMLSGNCHVVYTGVCLRSNSWQVSFTEETAVHFANLDDETIRRYVESGSCLDKAGSYGIQEWIGMVGVRRIEGCYYNVVGLPLPRLYSELTKYMRKH